jgi:copper chaperone CopZ
MTCEGCARVVRGLLSKVAGVESIAIDVAKQQVVVEGSASPAALLAALAKSGKVHSLKSS